MIRAFRYLAAAAIGARVRAWRQSRGMRLWDVELYSGIQAPSVAQIESGKHCPGLHRLERLAVALDVPLLALLPPDEPAQPDPAQWVPVPGHRPPRARRGRR
ncbi:MAG: helix-turn-helix domain-containing protein [Polyangiales bacterium]